MKTRESVGAFVVNKDGKFLLVRTLNKKYNHWDIPKGGVEEGETLLDALKRELKEEIGTDDFGKIKKLNLSFIFKIPEELRKHDIDSQKVELFFVEFKGKENDIKVDNKEISKAIFLSKNNFIEKVSFETTKDAFKEFLKKVVT